MECQLKISLYRNSADESIIIMLIVFVSSVCYGVNCIVDTTVLLIIQSIHLREKMHKLFPARLSDKFPWWGSIYKLSVYITPYLSLISSGITSYITDYLLRYHKGNTWLFVLASHWIQRHTVNVGYAFLKQFHIAIIHIAHTILPDSIVFFSFIQ